MFKLILILLAFAISVCCETAFATSTISPIGPFTGNLSEGFESFRPGEIPGPLRHLSGPVEVLAGHAALSGVHVDAQIRPLYIWNSIGGFHLGQGVNAVPFDGRNGLLLDSAVNIPIARLDFHNPVSQFGGYWWHADTITTAGPVTVSFFDGAGTAIGTQQFNYDFANLRGVSQWFGWSSTIPIDSLTFTGYWAAVDGIQVNLIPEPATALITFLASLALLSGRQALAQFIRLDGSRAELVSRLPSLYSGTTGQQN
jgi:hypothetical protein